MRNYNFPKTKKAFTLVELLIVIIIIAVLAAIAIPKFADSSLRGKESATRSNLKLLRNAVELFKGDTGVYPATLNDLAATTAPETGVDASGTSKAITASDYKGPYIQSIEKDSISGAAFNYSTTAGSVGKVTSSATGNSTNGTAYSSW